MKTFNNFSVLLCSIILLATSCQTKNENGKNIMYQTEIQSDTTGGVSHYQMNDYELIAIQDVNSNMSAKLFPDVKPELVDNLFPDGFTDASINVFLLKKDGKNILFDAGVGQYGMSQNKLKSLNISPEDIDYVFITHFHGDHIGGLLNEGIAAFPEAEIYVSEIEMDTWLNDAILQQRNALVKQIVEVYGDKIHRYKFGETIEGVTAYDANGHTLGHTVFEVGNLLIIGDLLHAANVQIADPYICALYDMNKIDAIDSRIRFYDYASHLGKTVAGMHLPFPGVISDFNKYWN